MGENAVIIVQSAQNSGDWNVNLFKEKGIRGLTFS